MNMSSVAGYDPALVKQLVANQRADLSMLGGAWCWAALGLAAPMAYAFALLTHSIGLSLLVAAGTMFLVLQLVRLTVTGSGTPLLWLAVLGVMFAQPAQLPLWHDAHAQLVAVERASLVEAHERVLGAADLRYARELSACAFLVLRLQAVWSEPARAARYSLAYLALLLGPALFARVQARGALHAYAYVRERQARRVIDRDVRSTRDAVASALARYRRA